MGYETQLFLVEHFGPWEFRDEPKGYPGDTALETVLACHAGQIIASIDLCKVGYDSALYDLFKRDRKKQKKENKWLYVEWHSPPDERPKLMDPYGDPLGLHDPQEVLDAIRAENEEDGGYRRFDMAIAMLEVFLAGKFGSNNRHLHVLSWGH